MEILFVILYDGLVNNLVFYLRRGLITLVDKEDETLQKVLLLAEVLAILLFGDLEGFILIGCSLL